MVWLLAIAAAAESAVVLLLVSKVSPLVELGQATVEVCRTNRAAAAIAKAVSAALVVLFASDLRSILSIRQRVAAAAATDADEVAVVSQLLEITLIGYCLVLELAASRLHSCLKQAEGLMRDVDALRKQAKGAQAEYLRLQGEQSLRSAAADEALAAEARSLKGIVSDLRRKLEQAQVDNNGKEKELRSARANVMALEKQTEGFRTEYGRLADDNEDLRNQLSAFDRKYANSDAKKYS